MRLVAKLTVALVLAMCAVLAFYGYLSVGRERAIVDAYRHRGDDLVLRALSTAVGEVWRRAGSAEALRLIADADARDDSLQLRWVWLDAPEGDPFHPAALPAPSDVAPGAEIVRVEEDGPRVFVYAPVDVGEPRQGAIELSESLEGEERFLRASALNATLTIVILVAVSGVLALGLGVWFVGRPVRSIIDKARRIGDGDLGGPLVLRQRDELATVASEINVMCERLTEARANLAWETSARIATLEQLRHADRLGTVGKLASGIAHELGTPLNVVGGRAKRILRGAPPEEVGDSARIIVEQTDRMAAIIRQLLDFARRRGAQKAPADLDRIARSVIALLTPLAEKRRVVLRREETGVATRADVDSGQIQQALMNLIMNGIQAMKSGGELTIAITRERVKPPAEPGGPVAEYLAIRVQDRGEGIAPEHIPHLFEPFFTTKEVGEGTGLGLSVSWGIVREHGGFITVASEPGQGATFTVYLPAS